MHAECWQNDLFLPFSSLSLSLSLFLTTSPFFSSLLALLSLLLADDGEFCVRDRRCSGRVSLFLSPFSFFDIHQNTA